MSEPTPAPALSLLLCPFTRFALSLRGLSRCIDEAAGLVAGPLRGVSRLRGLSTIPRLRINGSVMQRFDAAVIARIFRRDDDLPSPRCRFQAAGFDRGIDR